MNGSPKLLLATEHLQSRGARWRGPDQGGALPARKTLEEFDFTFQRSIKKQVIEHLGQLDFLHARENVILLGPPGTGKTHIAIALGSAPASPATASSSEPRPNGSRSSPTRNATAASTTSSRACNACRC